MDVRCEKCETVYELDDARVTDSGVDVQCTRCGEVFRVRRRPPAVTREMAGLPALSAQLGAVGGEAEREPDSSRERPWHLRLRRTQDVLRFKDLRALRQWILDGRVTRDDDISRGGKRWRRLGTVVELEAFFHAAEQVGRALLSTGRSAAADLPPPAAPVPTPPSSPRLGTPLAHEPRRLRTDTPGLGVGPPPGISPSPLLPPQASSTPTMIGPGTTQPHRVPQEGAPQAAMRLSSTGRTMRPRLQAGLASPPSGLLPITLRPPPEGPPPASPAPATAEAADRTAVPISGAIPHPIAPSNPAARVHPLPPELLPPRPQLDPLPAPAPPAAPEPPEPEAAPAAAIDDVIRRSDPVPRYLKESLSPRHPLDEAALVLNQAPDELPPLPDDALVEEPAERIRPRRIWLGLISGMAAACLAIVVLYAPARSRPPAAAKGPAAGSAQVTDGVYERGLRALARDTDEDYEQAQELLLRASGADETDARPLAGLAELHAVWARALQAEAQLQPAAAEALRRDAQRHLDKARRYAQEAVALSVQAPEAHRAMALVLIADGAERARVERHLTAAEQQDPTDPATAHARALLLVREHQPDAARAALARARAPLVRSLLLRGEIEREAGDRAAARQALEQARAAAPGHRRVEQALRALAADGGEAAAVPAAAEVRPAPVVAERPRPAAEREAPRDFAGQLGQARRLIEGGKAREALRLFEQLQREHDDQPEVHVGLGDCAVDMERYQAAVGHYKEALERSPDYPAAIIGLAEAYKLRGDRAEALRWYRLYLEKSPAGPQAALARNNVARLEPQVEAMNPPSQAPEPSP